VWLSVDGGKILSEERLQLSLKTSVIQALGWASSEKLSYEKGILSPERSAQYAMPVFNEIPPIMIDFSWNDSLIPKGIGELPFNTIPAAYAQAVTQAVDHPFNSLPITSKDIWQILSSKEDKEGLS
jgi:CO/xanthine dehydrogenase Mo-binding subunit